ncbi:PepSY-associated TM helix domain-containing protein [Pseudomonas sp. HR96]|uniref:PepSY-associated TM helix domain-containing protein n=1 Tax=Pseudomonas sp. HR96 TaxID=1027966 RepID=UPI002A7610B1|nr:PepSY-associated TM helix domain-containing protein [Pseudomonas sp. HR96]WPO97935.1 PepSY-associated TM helix domain-containing protein [Pseudomonas sp. HR96]
MKEGFRQAMAWLHTWAGLVVGWLLLAIFITGTATYYRQEITTWMHPEIHTASAISQTQALDGALHWLQEHAPQAQAWQISLPSARLPVTQVYWDSSEPPAYHNGLLDPASGQALDARQSQGGEFFYLFHYQLNLPPLIGRWIVGVAAMIMFIAQVTGIIIHKRIFKDFFTLRFGKGQRSWLDAHNSLSVLALPFHLLITYTGLVTLMYLYIPWGANAVYGDDTAALYSDVIDYHAPPPRADSPAPLSAAASIVEQARRQWGEGHVDNLIITSPGAANSRIEVVRDTLDQISFRAERLQLDGRDASLLGVSPPPGPAKRVYGVLYGLHMAHFADPLLRALLFICGLSGAAMVATGVQLWVIKRRSNGAGWLHRRIEGLNVAAICGLPLAIAGYFWANRLLPGALAGREAGEVQAFFGVWLLALLHAQWRLPQRVWQEQAGACALAFAGLPLLDGLTRPQASASTLLNGFNLAMLAVGAVFALGLWYLHRRAQKPVAAPLRRRAATPGNTQ